MIASEILLETVRIGPWLRVAAVDPVSLEEVVFQVPAGTALADIERLARAQLARRARLRLRKTASGGSGVVG